MKSWISVFLLLGTILLHPAAADAADATSPSNTSNPTLDGTWHWTFRMPDGTEVNSKVKLTQNGETVTGTTSHRAGTEVAIVQGVYREGEVRFDVVRERNGVTNVTHYAGRLNGDVLTGKVESGWNGTVTQYPWVARRHSGIDGTWTWKSYFRDREIDLPVTLKLDGDKLTGSMPGFGRRETPIKNASFKNGEVTFEVERGRDDFKSVQSFKGTLHGDSITGEIESTVGGDPQVTEWKARRVE